MFQCCLVVHYWFHVVSVLCVCSVLDTWLLRQVQDHTHNKRVAVLQMGWASETQSLFTTPYLTIFFNPLVPAQRQIMNEIIENVRNGPDISVLALCGAKWAIQPSTAAASLKHCTGRPYIKTQRKPWVLKRKK